MNSGTSVSASERKIRRASIDDVPGVVQLRLEMFRAMKMPNLDEPEWQATAHDWFANHLADNRVFIAVVEVSHQIVSTAMGVIQDSAPSPSCLDGRSMVISNVSTLPTARRLGHGRAAFNAVMQWARSTGVSRAELLATGDGQSMYQSAGFAPTVYPAMRASL